MQKCDPHLAQNAGFGEKITMTELERNLNEVTDIAAKTGKRIVSVDCPCCGKSFYALDDEVVFSKIMRDRAAEFGLDSKRLSGKSLGRKCPFCGYAGELGGGEFLRLDRGDAIKSEIEAERRAQELYDETRTPWSKVCAIGLDFGDKKDD